jgi:D-alanine-D-alanine ligase-like ATP-grasp enzyme
MESWGGAVQLRVAVTVAPTAASAGISDKAQAKPTVTLTGLAVTVAFRFNVVSFTVVTVTESTFACPE